MSIPIKSLKVVHVGCGGMAEAWLKVAATEPGLEIVGLVDLNIESAKKRQAQFAPSALISTDLAHLLNEARPDIVFNCTIPEAHYDVTMTALRHGCHVMCEKPLADSMLRAREMVRTAAEKGRIFAVLQNRRHARDARHVQSLLASNVIGEVTELNADFFLGAHFGGFRDEMEHVLLLDMAIHHFDLARFLASADATSVYCQEWNPKGSWYRHGSCADALFQMTNDLKFNYRGRWCSEGHHTVWNAAWRIVGTNGTLLWNSDNEISLSTVTKTGGFISETDVVASSPASYPGKENGHASLIQEFVACVRDGSIPETVASDNIKSLAMVFSAIESADLRQRVEISTK